MQDSVKNSNDVCSEDKNSSISSTDSGITIETMDKNCEELESKKIKAGNVGNNSPNLSIRSTVISINSIESSVIDSESEEEDLDNLIVKKLGRQDNGPENHANLVQSAVKSGVILSQIVDDKGGIISQTTTPKTQIGSVQVDRSNRVTIGDQNIFRGPTTVNLIVPPSHKLGSKNEKVNDGYDGEYEISELSLLRIFNETHQEEESEEGRKSENATGGIASKNLMKDKTFLAGLTVAIVTILVLITGIIVWTTQSQENIGSGLVLRRVTRDEWVAQPPKTQLEKLQPPVSRVIIAHTATEACDVQSTCVFRVRYIQSFHMDSKGWDDISYNFLIGEDGMIYDGRGWDSVGAHTKGYNYDSVGIAFIGTFSSRVPNNKSLNVYNLLIEEGIRLKKVKSDYKLYATRQLNGSESPGKTFFDLIKTWSHWTDEL